MTTSLLRVDASMRRTGSTTRRLTDALIETLAPSATTTRDLADGIPLIDEAWIGANFTPEDQRSDAQRAALATSDALVAELAAADTLVIGLPIYNFSIPAALKAWIDQIARAGLTFRYTETGPKGLLTGKTAYLVVASGGTQMDSAIDFATAYMRHALSFVGIEDVRVVDATGQMSDAEAVNARAQAQISAHATAAQQAA